MQNRRRWIAWAIAVAAIAGTALIAAGYWVRLEQLPLQELIACQASSTAGSFRKWSCGRAIAWFRLSRREVNLLNQQAGARFVLAAPDGQERERLLQLFLERGVDINSVDRRTGLTALHEASSTPHDVEGIRLLLQYGARRSVPDTSGRTPLERVRQLQAQHGDLDYRPVMQLLYEPNP
jgi:hypothetical protein